MNDERTEAIHDLLILTELGMLDTMRLPKNDAKGKWHGLSDARLVEDMFEEDGEVRGPLMEAKDVFDQEYFFQKMSSEALDHIQLELRDKLVTTAFLYERVRRVMKDRGAPIH